MLPAQTHRIVLSRNHMLHVLKLNRLCRWRNDTDYYFTHDQSCSDVYLQMDVLKEPRKLSYVNWILSTGRKTVQNQNEIRAITYIRTFLCVSQ